MTGTISDNQNVLEQYPHVLMLYKKPPEGEIDLREFEDLAFDRLKALRILEQATLMGQTLYSPEWKATVLNYFRNQDLDSYVSLIKSSGCSKADAKPSIRREDYLSHFILRLAYCRSESLRNWFIARELELFKLRFLSLSPNGIKQFFLANKLDYTPVPNEEKDKMKDKLIKSTDGYSVAKIESSDFYKVPFTDVVDLVYKTSVYLHKGYAYIPAAELLSCMTNWFQEHLTASLMMAYRTLPGLNDARITGLLASLHESYTGKDYSNVSSVNKSLTAETVHVVARKSFPLCMKNLHGVLKVTNHLKHFGRLQFGLFLKGIGLSLEEAIKYWRTEFGRSIDEDTFNKKYLYNIKHSYGSIGKMTSYSPYGCLKIISASPGAGEHHGCPFKLWNSETLKQKMLEYGVDTKGVTEVLTAVEKGNYQIACTKYFTHTHGGTQSKDIINHPNQYYEESRTILDPKEPISNSSYKRKYPDLPQSSHNSSGNSSFDSTPASKVS